MKISELFYSIQGEGQLTGVPSVFIRVFGCNLQCKWCDTIYEDWYSDWQEMPIDIIINETNLYPTNYVVITGGEPMLSSEIHNLSYGLASSGKHITIETSGTILPQGEIKCSLMSISPKLSNSVPDSLMLSETYNQKRINIDCIRELIDKYEYQLKFVLCDRSDIDEIQDIISNIKRMIPAEKILLMPEGKIINHKQRDFVVEFCKKYGYRYCNRLHIDLFGNKKGT